MIQFSVLGPFELRDRSGAPAAIASDRARTLLALLVLRRNEIASVDWLIDGIWGDAAPCSARKNVQTYVWRIRRLLTRFDTACLESRRTGYTLRILPGSLDLDEFERHAAEGERLLAAGAMADASSALERALLLWRGQPFSDVAFAGPPRGELVRLAERRMTVLESRIAADLHCGRWTTVIPELKKLTVDYPYREGLRAQLMTALTRCGRRMEALSVYSDVRSILRRDFGMEPGPALRRAEAELLREGPPD